MRFKVLRSVCGVREGHTLKSYGPGMPEGDVIESDKDMVAIHGANKFQRLPDHEVIETPATEEDPLAGKKVRELRELAEREGVDLGEAVLKDDILGILREQFTA